MTSIDDPSFRDLQRGLQRQYEEEVEPIEAMADFGGMKKQLEEGKSLTKDQARVVLMQLDSDVWDIELIVEKIGAKYFPEAVLRLVQIAELPPPSRTYTMEDVVSFLDDSIPEKKSIDIARHIAHNSPALEYYNQHKGEQETKINEWLDAAGRDLMAVLANHTGDKLFLDEGAGDDEFIQARAGVEFARANKQAGVAHLRKDLMLQRAGKAAKLSEEVSDGVRKAMGGEESNGE